jgi:hypothetical protein
LQQLTVLGASAAFVLVLSACGEGSTDPGPEPEEDVLGVSAVTPTSDSRVATDGLVASYDMTTLTSSGNLRDFSGRDLHGIIEGTTVVQTPRGGGRQFAAATDRVALPPASDFDLNGPISIVARFRVDLAKQHQHIIACDNKWVLWVNHSDRVRFGNTRGDAMESAEPLSAEEWHVVIAVLRGTAGDVLDDSNIELWIDGVRADVDLLNSSGPPVVWQQGTLLAADACFIGFESHAGEQEHQNLPFFGVIDEVMVFERALSTEEVATLSVSP